MSLTTSSQLKAIDFTSEIARLTKDFIGRQWVIDHLDRWIKESEKRFFILTGEPGVGKSAIAAKLTQIRQDIVAYHFCIAGRSGTIQPNRVILSLAAQLVEYFPDYAKKLANIVIPRLSIESIITVNKMKDCDVRGIVIENLHTQSPQELLDILLRRPLAELPHPPEKPVVILIDSLDEAVTYDAQENLVTLLSGLRDLPEWLRLMVTTRPDEEQVLSYLNPLKHDCYHLDFYYLDKLSPKNQNDVSTYVEKKVIGKAIQTRLPSYQTNFQFLVKQITELSKGNFLYAKVLIDDIENGRQSLDDLDALPKSLEDIYHNFLMRLKPEWENKYQFIFGILTVTKAPVTKDEIINFIALNPSIKLAPSETELNHSLGVVEQFISITRNKYGQDTYQIFHKSLRDYLLDRERAPTFWCSPRDSHRWIIEYCWQYHPDDWQDCDRYGLRFLAAHLMDLAAAVKKLPTQAREHIKKLHELLATETPYGKNAWFVAKNSIGDMSGYLEDVKLAWQQVAQDLKKNASQAIALLCRYALINASMISWADIPPDLLVALVEHQDYKEWTLEQAFVYARQMPNLRKKIASLEGLLSLPSSLQQKSPDTYEQIRHELHKSKRSVKERTQNHKIQSQPPPIQSLLDLSNPLTVDAWRQALKKTLENLKEQEQEIQEQEKLIQQVRVQKQRERFLNKQNQLVHEKKRQQAELRELVQRIPDLSNPAEIFDEVLTLKIGSYRTQMLLRLAPYLNDDEQQQRLVKAICSIRDKDRRASALSQLIKRLPNLADSLKQKILHEAVQAAFSILKDEWYITETRITLIAQLISIQEQETEFREIIFKEIEDILTTKWEFLSTQINMLILIAPYLPEPFKEKALTQALGIQEDGIKARVLTALFPYLSDSLKLKSYDELVKIRDKKILVEVLTKIAPILPDLLKQRALKYALEIISNINNLSQMEGEFIKKLVAYSPDRLKYRAIKIVMKMEASRAKVEALTELASTFPISLKQKALRRAVEIILEMQEAQENRLIIVGSLTHIAQRCSISDPLRQEILESALQAISEIQNKITQTEELIELLIHFPDILKQKFSTEKVLQIISEVPDEKNRVNLLTRIAISPVKSLKQKAWHQLQEIFTKINDPKFQGEVLLKLLFSFTGSLKQQALQQAKKIIPEIQDLTLKADLLTELSHELPIYYQEAVKNALKIKDDYVRRERLSRLIKNLLANCDQLETSDNLKSSLMFIWCKVLAIEANTSSQGWFTNRQRLLVNLNVLIPTLHPLKAIDSIPAILKAIHSIGQWWF